MKRADGQPYDICAAVISDLSTDARVWREARSLSAHGFSVGLIGCAYEIDGVRRRSVDGIDVLEVPLGSRHGRVSHLGRVRTLLAVWREIIRTPARAYHVHNIHPAPASVIAARRHGARWVYDAHELYGNPGPRTPPRWWLDPVLTPVERWLEHFLVRRAFAVITTNRSRAAELELRHRRSAIVVLANVPDRVDEVKPIDLGFAPNEPVLLYQGGIYLGRAFRETIEALTELEGVQFAVIGFGRETDLDRIRQWAREYGVADRVHLLGTRHFDELVHTAASATLGLVPIKPNHQSDLLGDTNKLHEYLMAGLPVVASDLPEIRRVVTEGDPPVGELFDPAQPATIVAAVTRVIKDGRYKQRRCEARRLALARHNWQVQEGALVAIYNRLLQGQPTDRSSGPTSG
jgi:glycosyltransferase involved in cell wall biosynthesis